MVDITEISAIVAAAGVLVGVVFTVMELRNLVKQRQTDLVTQLSRDIGSGQRSFRSVCGHNRGRV